MSEYIRDLEDSAGAKWNAAAHTATFTSEVLNLGECDRWGILLDVGTVSGTSPTLNIEVQTSFDGGTTWLDTYPTQAASGSQANLAEITASTEISEVWDRHIPCERPNAPVLGGGSFTPRVRFNCVIAGTSPSFTITNAYFYTLRFRTP